MLGFRGLPVAVQAVVANLLSLASVRVGRVGYGG